MKWILNLEIGKSQYNYECSSKDLLKILKKIILPKSAEKSVKMSQLVAGSSVECSSLAIELRVKINW